MNTDPRVDAYIAKAAPFAQPILSHLRALVHETCPAVQETMKWSMPFFMYRGMFCHMAAFKRHCAFSFWKGNRVVDETDGEAAMGQFGRIEKLSDLPSKTRLVGHLRKAMALNETGEPSAARGKRAAAKPELEVPDDLVAALRRNAKARKAFETFSPSHRREYVEWITDAKRTETRARRLATAVEWLAEGKPRNWRYRKG